MTHQEKEVVEGNILIAEFMGANKSGYGDYMIFTVENPMRTGKINHEEIIYHTSWDWLMPVVEKIWGLPSEEHTEKIATALQLVIIDALWLAVVEFVKWYNQNK